MSVNTPTHRNENEQKLQVVTEAIAQKKSLLKWMLNAEYIAMESSVTVHCAQSQ